MREYLTAIVSHLGAIRAEAPWHDSALEGDRGEGVAISDDVIHQLAKIEQE